MNIHLDFEQSCSLVMQSSRGWVSAAIPEYPAHYLPDRDASAAFRALPEQAVYLDITKVETDCFQGKLHTHMYVSFQSSYILCPLTQ